MPKELVITALNIRSLKLNDSKIFKNKLNYLLSINSDILILLEINTHTTDWDSAAQKIFRFELRNHNYFITEPEPEYSTKFSLAPMGVLAPGSAHARPSAEPPIDVSGNFPPRMY